MQYDPLEMLSLETKLHNNFLFYFEGCFHVGPVFLDLCLP